MICFSKNVGNHFFSDQKMQNFKLSSNPMSVFMIYGLFDVLFLLRCHVFIMVWATPANLIMIFGEFHCLTFPKRFGGFGTTLEKITQMMFLTSPVDFLS